MKAVLAFDVEELDMIEEAIAYYRMSDLGGQDDPAPSDQARALRIEAVVNKQRNYLEGVLLRRQTRKDAPALRRDEAHRRFSATGKDREL